MRVRYWASALRWFPQDCQETFSVDRSTDTLTLRQKISYVPIENAWSTKPLKLNPASPTLALASRDANLPVKFSHRVMDLEMPTHIGPYMAAQTDEPLEAAFHALQYINEGAPTSVTNVIPATERGSWSRWAPSAHKRDHCIALAHNAYRAGQIDDYNYACYLFTRGFTHHYFTNRTAEYARTLTAREVAPQPTAVAAQPRLIPSGPPTPFVPGIEREMSQPDQPLAAQVIPADGDWPQLALRGTELRFGSIKVGNASPKKTNRVWHSPTSERIVVLR
jgi:hypothetical protein